MFQLRFSPGQAPIYMTEGSAGADLLAAEQVTIAGNSATAVPTGVWIDQVHWDQVPSGSVPELQVRARSGLALKHGLTMMNGVGTIDADYRDEICVLLWNTRTQTYTIEKGMRIAQLICHLTYRISGLAIQGQRLGGFGSTGH